MLVAILFWFVGLMVSSFTLIPICICIFFAFPFTRHLAKNDALVANHPIYKNYTVSVVVLTVIWLVVFGLIAVFGSTSALRGFIGGAVVTLLFGIWKTGKNQNNLSEYLEKNKTYIVTKQEIA